MSGRLGFISLVVIILALSLAFIIFTLPNKIVPLELISEDGSAVDNKKAIDNEVIGTSSNLATNSNRPRSKDVAPQLALINPPKTIKAIYATSWSMSHAGKTKYLLDLIDSTELNAIVIDIKDYTGIVPYDTELDLVERYNAEEIRISKINQLIKDLHDRGIYVIGRLSVFQDVALAKARPDLALISSSTGKTWVDNKGLAWMDTSALEVWDYNIAIAREALERGFDEINFDYIRFASDGKLSDIRYPFWDEKKLKVHVVRDFFKYLRESLGKEAIISADLFGLVTVNTDGLGIGQHLEYALPYFDAIAPMVYPSHYFPGFIGFQNPSAHPYEVIKYSMDRAMERLQAYRKMQIANPTSTPPMRATLRPWIQDFDLGADYDAAMVRSEFQAWYDSASTSPEFSSGWMIWNASNKYTRDALLPSE